MADLKRLPKRSARPHVAAHQIEQRSRSHPSKSFLLLAPADGLAAFGTGLLGDGAGERFAAAFDGAVCLGAVAAGDFAFGFFAVGRFDSLAINYEAVAQALTTEEKSRFHFAFGSIPESESGKVEFHYLAPALARLPNESR